MNTLLTKSAHKGFETVASAHQGGAVAYSSCRLVQVAESTGGLLLLCIGLAAPAQTLQQTAPDSGPKSVPGAVPGIDYAVVARDGNQKVWAKTTWERNAAGELLLKTNSYTELATGSSHLANGVWVDSSDQLTITKTGAQATNSQHKVAFLTDINSAGAIDLTLPEGDKHLVSTILGLSYFDAGTGKSVLIAELTNSIGRLLPSGNDVLYPDCFTDIHADALFQNRIDRFEQLIVLREQLPSPSEWGLSPDSSVLQVITEFTDPPTPKITQTVIDSGSDDQLDFGIMLMPKGSAFALGAETNSIPVTKQWLLLDGRRCLVESTPFKRLAPLLKELPAPSGHAALRSSPDSVLHRVAQSRLLPAPKLAARSAQPLMVARAEPKDKGVAIDYTALTTQTDATLQSDMTYYLSGAVTLSGTTTIEGGTVTKITNSSSAKITINGTLRCLTSAYRPAIFTAKDDDSVGAQIPGSTSAPTNYYGNGLYLNSSSISLHDLRFSYSTYALNYNHTGTGSLNLTNVQFVKCRYPIYAEGSGLLGGDTESDVNIDNALCDACDTFISGVYIYFYGRNLTIHRCNTLTSVQLWDGSGWTWINSLLVGVTNWDTTSTSTNSTVFFSTDPGTIFQSAGAGSHYLADNSPYRNAGSTNISGSLLSALKQKTTYPPIIYSNITFTTDATLSPQAQRDTDTPDLGYHYDPIDFIADSVTASNAVLTIAPGTTVAGYNDNGIWLREGSSVSSVGTPLAPIWFTRYQTVQEQPIPMGPLPPASGWPIIPYHTNTPFANGVYRFTRFSCPADGGINFYHTTSWSYGSLLLVDSEIWGGGNKFEGAASTIAVLNNNLFHRGTFYMYPSSTNSLAISNNLFRCVTGITVRQLSTAPWAIYNNEFNSCSFGLTLALTSSGNNSYWNSNKQLNPTNASDITLTNAIAYQIGPLGTFYQPTNSPLVNMGSCTADLAGLFHYTVMTNLVGGFEIKEGSTVVDIGLHYVTVDSNGIPIDIDGDGVPDYLADANGNGVLDFGEIPFGITIENPRNGSFVP